MIKKKKGIELSTGAIIAISLAIVGLLFIFPLVLRSEEVAKKILNDDVCEGSVALRLKSKTEIVATEIATPLLCKTDHVELPLKGDTSEDFLRDQSEFIASIWKTWQRGEGDEVFLWKGYLKSDAKTKCFKSNTYDIKKLKDRNKITFAELRIYMMTHLYEVEEEDNNCKNEGGFCATSEEAFRLEKSKLYEEDITRFKFDTYNKKCLDINPARAVCSYSRYECLNKGGICKDSDFISTEYKEYNQWNCPGKKKCFVDADNYITYMDYIRNTGGYIQVPEDLEFTPTQQYEIAFASKMNVDWKSSFDRIFEYITEGDKEVEPPRIVITELGKMDDLCLVEEDVRGVS